MRDNVQQHTDIPDTHYPPLPTTALHTASDCDPHLENVSNVGASCDDVGCAAHLVVQNFFRSHSLGEHDLEAEGWPRQSGTAIMQVGG